MSRTHTNLIAMGLLTAGVLTTGLVSAAYAAEQIKGIDFIATPGETNILIKSGHNVPYRTVSVADTKIIIDLENVNAEDSINTFFKGSRNVSHVVLQPLSSDKLRMIIKGSDLGKPVIGFDRAGSKPQAAPVQPEEDGWINEMDSALDQLGDDGMQDATYNPDALGDAEDAMHGAAYGGNAATETAAKKQPAATPENTLINRGSAPEPSADTDISDIIDEPIGAQAIRESNTATEAESNNPLNLPLGDWPIKDWAPYGIAGALIIGLGVFIKHKLDRMHVNNASFDTLMNEHEQGKAVSFRDLANAYKKDPNTAQRTGKKAHASKPRSASPIGLGGLAGNPNEIPAAGEPTLPGAEAPLGDKPMSTDTLRALQSRLASASRILPDKQASIPQQPMQTPPPARQAVNQYARSQKPALKKANAAPAARKIQNAGHAPEDILRAELARKRDIQSQMNPRPARKAPSLGAQQQKAKPAMPQRQPASRNGSPLPDNPAVLNFLKDVADRIEREGKPDLARSIQKKLDA